ncbi:MAG: 50S ribosomal protein L16 [Buchnera aphidicola (Tetraneura sorini)]
MLQPKRTKYRKMHKGRNRGLAIGREINFGSFGLKSIDRGRITSRQIESARRTISRAVKRQGKMWIRIFPDKPITKKPLEVRMGKGKGNVEYWVALVQPGTILYEIEGISEEDSRLAFKLAASKLPVRTIFIKKRLNNNEFI